MMDFWSGISKLAFLPSPVKDVNVASSVTSSSCCSSCTTEPKFLPSNLLNRQSMPTNTKEPSSNLDRLNTHNNTHATYSCWAHGLQDTFVGEPGLATHAARIASRLTGVCLLALLSLLVPHVEFGGLPSVQALEKAGVNPHPGLGMLLGRMASQESVPAHQHRGDAGLGI